MGRRGEQRTAISIPILVRGKDSHGSPFVAATETCEISPYGACVKGRGGLDSIVRPGMIRRSLIPWEMEGTQSIIADDGAPRQWMQQE